MDLITKGNENCNISTFESNCTMEALASFCPYALARGYASYSKRYNNNNNNRVHK